MVTVELVVEEEEFVEGVEVTKARGIETKEGGGGLFSKAAGAKDRWREPGGPKGMEEGIGFKAEKVEAETVFHRNRNDRAWSEVPILLASSVRKRGTRIIFKRVVFLFHFCHISCFMKQLETTKRFHLWTKGSSSAI